MVAGDGEVESTSEDGTGTDGGMLELDRVGRVYGRSPGRRSVALDGLSLRVSAGECLAIVGPNGAGKSTLLSLALGFDRPTSGRIGIEGRRPGTWVRCHGAAHLPEGFGVRPRGRVRESLVRHALLDGLRGRRLRDRVDGVLERAGLTRDADRPAGDLSKGSLQRLGLAQLLLRPRRLVVLDEPASGLDPVWRARLAGLVDEMRAWPTDPAILLASHDLRAVTRVADRVAVLAGGRLRTVVDLGGVAAAGYRLALDDGADPRPWIPDAVAADEPGAWRVPARDASSLREPLRRLLASGAVLERLTPEARDLEAVVERACREAADDVG